MDSILITMTSIAFDQFSKKCFTPPNLNNDNSDTPFTVNCLSFTHLNENPVYHVPKEIAIS